MESYIAQTFINFICFKINMEYLLQFLATNYDSPVDQTTLNTIVNSKPEYEWNSEIIKEAVTQGFV